jgi:hypothetical protein
MGRVLTQAMSSLLRFADALRVDLSQPRSHRWQIVLPAVFGTLLSTMVVGDLFFLSLSKAAAASKAELLTCLHTTRRDDPPSGPRRSQCGRPVGARQQRGLIRNAKPN